LPNWQIAFAQLVMELFLELDQRLGQLGVIIRSPASESDLRAARQQMINRGITPDCAILIQTYNYLWSLAYRALSGLPGTLAFTDIRDDSTGVQQLRRDPRFAEMQQLLRQAELPAGQPPRLYIGEEDRVIPILTPALPESPPAIPEPPPIDPILPVPPSMPPTDIEHAPKNQPTRKPIQTKLFD
jgi:hypothetical protein